MNTSLHIIRDALEAHPRAILCFSGGGDSAVLADLVYRHTDHRPPMLWADTQMEYPETETFVRSCAERYGVPLFVVRGEQTPAEQWAKQGWPFLGKLAAIEWNRRNPHLGIRLNVSACCRNMKIAPARQFMRRHGLTLQLTGQRGDVDDRLRGMRALKDGVTHYVKADRISVCNPLTGWTETMIRRYTAQHDLAQHPAKARGAATIGCLYCGGGAQFAGNSGWQILHDLEPDRWRWFFSETGAGAGLPALVVRYRRHIDLVREAVKGAGGIAHLLETAPHLFCYAYRNPLPANYTR